MKQYRHTHYDKTNGKCCQVVAKHGEYVWVVYGHGQRPRTRSRNDIRTYDPSDNPYVLPTPTLSLYSAPSVITTKLKQAEHAVQVQHETLAWLIDNVLPVDVASGYFSGVRVEVIPPRGIGPAPKSVNDCLTLVYTQEANGL